jgi:hypothetical protein
MNETDVIQGGAAKCKEKFPLKRGRDYAYEMDHGIKIGLE